MEFYMRFFSLLVVLVLSINLTVKSEEVNDPAPFKTKLHEEIKTKLCVDLKKYFEKAGYPLVIGVGEFTSTPDLDANYSNGIKNTITVELKNIGFTVEKKAKYYLEGKYSKIPNGDKGISVKISFTLMDLNIGESLTKFPIRIDDYVDVAQTLGVTSGLGKADVVNDKSLININQKCCTGNYHVKKISRFFRKRNTSNLFLNNDINAGNNTSAGSNDNAGYARNSNLNMFGD